ncbi:hypothetical protein NDU88_003702 [Pleurodeles waltl]|uniref:Uncharacterized protein n=1 Tax=Pleurodeles waltl TaxID=8319 RepID=A0AAV7WT67_PLEWA|nr:hypothetical protein NDU88_003702 [Pleurodeles waltl]
MVPRLHGGEDKGLSAPLPVCAPPKGIETAPDNVEKPDRGVVLKLCAGFVDRGPATEGHNLHELNIAVARGGATGLLRRLLSPGPDNPVVETNLLLRNAARCWFKYIRRSDRVAPYALQLPLWVLPGVDPTQLRLPTIAWEGITDWGDLFVDSMLMPFNNSLSDFSPPPGSLLTYALLTQVAAVAYWDSLPHKPATSVVLQTILTHGNANKAVTNLYNALRIDNAVHLTSLRTYWGEALRSVLTDGQWQQALAAPKIISMNGRYIFIQFNY